MDAKNIWRLGEASNPVLDSYFSVGVTKASNVLRGNGVGLSHCELEL